MQDHKNALKMLNAAQRDFKALKSMTDEAQFDVEIFGFHAQQTVEKLLKAWLSNIGVKYERIHDLQILFSLLKDNGQNIPMEFDNLENLTDFAVRFRYEVFETMDASINRKNIIGDIKRLLELIEKAVL